MQRLRHSFVGLLAALTVFTVGFSLTAAVPRAEAAGPLGLCMGSGCVIGTPTVYYVDWTSINNSGGVATGAITLPSGPPVSVTFTAANPDGSAGSFYGSGQTGCGTSYWIPTTPYVSPQVPNPPPPCDMVGLRGGTSTIYRMTFSQAVQDPFMAILSLGQGGVPTTYDFDRPFDIVSQGSGFFGGTSTSLQKLSGDVLEGREGHGTIRFPGTFPTFTWTVPTPETWHGFTFGIRTTTALSGAQVVVNEGTTATNTGRWGGTAPTLTASVGTVIRNADGTWNWSFATDDGPAQDQEVTITATEGSSSVSQKFNLMVKNVMPWATLGNDGPKPVGVPVTASFTGAVDPSGADTMAGFHYAFDCNGGTLAGITYATTGVSASVQCTYLTAGPVTITGRIIDKDNEDGHFDHTTTTTVIADVTPPVITPTVTGTLGSNGWYVGDVHVSWTVTDGESTISTQSGCDASDVTADTAGATFTCTATSAGGTASESVTVKRDATAPVATAVAAPAPNGNGWNNTDVTVSFSGTDTGSGIASCTAPLVLGEGAAQSASGTCADNAGNVSPPATASNINVDKTAPAVAVTGVTNGASYIVGGVPAAGCSTTDGLSGVAAAATLSVSGGPLGSVTVTCAGGTDRAGNAAAPVTATYAVTYAFCGFKQPLLVPVQEFKAGSTIPVKFCVQDASGASVATATGTVEAYVNGSLMATTFAIRYDASAQQYIANVQTKDGKVDWPTGVLELRVKLNDGTTNSTNAVSTAGVKGGLKLR